MGTTILYSESVSSFHKTPQGFDGGSPEMDAECEFSQDCQDVGFCRNIADAWCVCRFGSCVVEGFCWAGELCGDPECSNYTDCDCRDSPSTCFCRGWPASCENIAWECRTSEDCKILDKCTDKDCGCHANLCEHECDNSSDCVDLGHHCSFTEGYSCACE